MINTITKTANGYRSTDAVFYVLDNAVRSFPDNIIAGPFVSSVDADCECARLSAAGRDCRVERDETIGAEA